ncbi:MAG: RNA polymerase sigma factor [Thermoguttaceae bacterium]
MCFLLRCTDLPSSCPRSEGCCLRFVFIFPWLAEILLSLPEVQRRAICLRHMEGLKLDAIAEELGRSVGAVVGLIDRGLTVLRKTMSEQSWT